MNTEQLLKELVYLLGGTFGVEQILKNNPLKDRANKLIINLNEYYENRT